MELRIRSVLNKLLVGCQLLQVLKETTLISVKRGLCLFEPVPLSF